MYTLGQKSAVCQGPGTGAVLETVGSSVRLSCGTLEDVQEDGSEF